MKYKSVIQDKILYFTNNFEMQLHTESKSVCKCSQGLTSKSLYTYFTLGIMLICLNPGFKMLIYFISQNNLLPIKVNN